MATIVLRQTKGSALTFQEGDDNFQNLNTDKVELDDLSVSQATASGDGTLSYNNTTGEFTYTPPDLSSYLTDYTVTEGDVTAHQAALSITESQISDLQSYLTSYTETDPVVGAVNGIVKADGAGNISAASAGTDYINLSNLSITTASVGETAALSYNNTTGVFTFTPTDTSDLLGEVVEDLTPQLGGALDCQGNDIRNAVLEDYAETIHSLGSTDTPTITISNGNVQSVTITSGLALPAFSDAAAGQSVTLIVSGTGSATGTAAYRFAGGNKTLTTLSVVSVFYDGTNYFASIATDFQA